MPKSRVALRKGQKPVPRQVSFKLGGRKSTESALALSNEDLLARLSKGGKDVSKIVQVLAKRGVDYPSQSQLKTKSEE